MLYVYQYHTRNYIRDLLNYLITLIKLHIWISRNRSPLPGASIFHTDPLSQPCSVFLDAPPPGAFAGVLIIANHKTAVVLYRCVSHAYHTIVFQ